MAPGRWYHVAVTNVGSSTTLYLDGIAVANGTFTINTSANTSFYMGRIPGTLGDTRRLDGQVDEVSVYNHALTADEIRAIYRAGAGGKIKGPGITVTPIAGLTTTEGGTTASFSVVLNTAPLHDVMIGISSSDTSEGIVSPVLLTFTSANWNAPQSVTVEGVDDSALDGLVSYTILVGPASSSDGNYEKLDPPDVSVANVDNEAPTGPQVFHSLDTPLAIADLHPKKGPQTTTSHLEVTQSALIDALSITITLDGSSDLSDLSDWLLTSPGGETETIMPMFGTSTRTLVNFDGVNALGTWTLAITDNVKGNTHTLSGWSLTVTPLAGAATGQRDMVSATDLFFLDLDVNPANEKNQSDLLPIETADQLASVLHEGESLLQSRDLLFAKFDSAISAQFGEPVVTRRISFVADLKEYLESLRNGSIDEEGLLATTRR